MTTDHETTTVESEVLQSIPLKDFEASPGSRHRWLSGTSASALFLLSLFLPVWFGGVHTATYVSARAICFVVILLLVILQPSKTAGFAWNGPVSRIATGGLAVLFLLGLAQFAWLLATRQPHPVLGTAIRHLNPAAGVSALGEVLFFLAAFIVARVWLRDSRTRLKRALSILFLSVLVTTLIALSHWFYDNGRLFWTFEPEHVFISLRARWPFVNANHLAHFFLIPAFLLVSQLLIETDALWRQTAADAYGKKKALTRLIASPRVQTQIVRLLFFVILLISVVICIAGSLSRAGWLGLAFGTLSFLLLYPLARRPQNQSASGKPGQAQAKSEDSALAHPAVVDIADLSSSRHESRRRHRHHRSASSFDFIKLASKCVKPIVILSVLIVFLLFFRDRGRELFLDRLDYGLMHSKDDLRFQLYSDTWPMILDNIWVGTGLGTWSKAYPKYMDSQMSGLKPVYLHSDPLQLLSETGLIGALSLLLLSGLILREAIRALAKSRSLEMSLLIAALLSGFVALCVASCLDFPFRVPAITFYSAIYLAMLAAACEAKQNGVSQDRSIGAHHPDPQ